MIYILFYIDVKLITITTIFHCTIAPDAVVQRVTVLELPTWNAVSTTSNSRLLIFVISQTLIDLT